MIEWLVKPIIGGLIGYTTNWLAIKMLFKPYTEKRIGPLKVPFTPGLIPRERDRIAKSLGEAVGDNLLTPDVIRQELLSENVTSHIHDYVTKELLGKDIVPMDMLNKVLGDGIQETLEDVSRYIGDTILSYLTSEEMKTLFLERLKGEIKDALVLSASLKDYIKEEGVETIEGLVVKHLPEMLSYIENTLDEPAVHHKIASVVNGVIMEKVGALGAMFINPDDMASTIVEYIKKTMHEEETQSGIEVFIRQAIHKVTNQSLDYYITREQLDDLTRKASIIIVDRVMKQLFETNVSPFIKPIVQQILLTPIVLKESYKEGIQKQVVGMYRSFVEENVETFLNTFNVSGIVESEINRFSVMEVEKLIFHIVDKELNAITWLGGLLGFVIGIIYIFI